MRTCVRLRPASFLPNDHKPRGFKQQTCLGPRSPRSVSAGPRGPLGLPPVPSSFWWPQPCSLYPLLRMAPLFCLLRDPYSGRSRPPALALPGTGLALLRLPLTTSHTPHFWVPWGLGTTLWCCASSGHLTPLWTHGVFPECHLLWPQPRGQGPRDEGVRPPSYRGPFGRGGGIDLGPAGGSWANPPLRASGAGRAAVQAPELSRWGWGDPEESECPPLV